MEYRKFTLSPGQQSPAGSTGVTLLTGEIVWYGEEGTFPAEITSEVMTQAEIDEYTWIVDFPDRIAAARNLFEGSILYDITYANVDTYINNNVTDLASARVFLKKLGKIVLALLKFNGLVK